MEMDNGDGGETGRILEHDERSTYNNTSTATRKRTRFQSDGNGTASDSDPETSLHELKRAKSYEHEVFQSVESPEPVAPSSPPFHPPLSPQGQRNRDDLDPEYLRTLSPRTLHRTLMAAVSDDWAFSDSSSFNISEDMDSYSGNRFFASAQAVAALPALANTVEYEIGSVSPSRENPNPIEDMLSSSDDEAIDELYHQYCTSSNSGWSARDEAERDDFADSSASESDIRSKRSGLTTDSEISDQDKWFCSQCNARTNNPYFRYCLRCFTLRRNWLPARPRGKAKTRPPDRLHRQRLRALYTYAEEPPSIPCSTPDDDRPNSSTCSKEVPVTSTRSASPSSSIVGSEASKSKTNPSAYLAKLQSTLNAPPVSVALAPDTRDEPLCIICMGREKNAGFVHGKSAHFCCCYQCGDKILKRTGRCPVCRKRILRVVKIIS